MSEAPEREPGQPGPLLRYATPGIGIAAGVAALTVALWPLRLDWADAFSAGASAAFLSVLIVEVIVMVLSEGRIRSAYEGWRTAEQARLRESEARQAAEARADIVEQALQEASEARQEAHEARLAAEARAEATEARAEAAQRRLERVLAALINGKDIDPKIIEALKE